MSQQRKRTTGVIVLAVIIVSSMLAISSIVVDAVVNEQTKASAIATCRSSSCYALNSNQWTVFGISPNIYLMKIVTNANVRSDLVSETSLTAAYTIEYQVLSDDMTVICSRKYSQKSRQLSFRNSNCAATKLVQFYLDREIVPLASRTIVVNLSGLLKPACFLRVALAWADDAVSGVMVRVYKNEPPPEYKRESLWQRYPVEKRRRLARFSIYSLDLLTPQERQSLFENKWSAVGPRGVKGRDYEEAKIYSFDGDGREEVMEAIAPLGLLVSSGMVGVIALPETGGCVRLRIEAVSDSMSKEQQFALVTWRDWRGRSRRDWLVGLCEGEGIVKEEFCGGALEVSGGCDLVARAFIEDGLEPVEITPQLEYVGCYLLGPGAAVEFSSTGLDKVISPLRVDVRSVGESIAAMQPEPCCVEFELCDESGNVYRRGYYAHCERRSMYDRLSSTSQFAWVSDPSSLYLPLGPQCTSVKLRSSDPNVIVAAYTRPGGMERRVSVPERYRWSEGMEDEDRDWFLVRPSNYVQCLQSNRELALISQRRTTADHALESEGQEQTEILEATGDTQAFKVMRRTDPRHTLSADGPSNSFILLQQKVLSSLLFSGAKGSKYVVPRALCINWTGQSVNVVLRVDGREYNSSIPKGRVFELEFPAVEVGRHLVEYSSDSDISFYINKVSDPLNDRYLEQSLYRCDEDPVTYRVELEHRTTLRLFLRVFCTLGSERRTDLMVSISDCRKQQGVPASAWTFPTSVYSVRIDGSEVLPLWGAAETFVVGNEKCTLTLGDDLEPGEKTIAIERIGGPPCYLLLSRATEAKDAIKKAYLKPQY